MFPLYSALGDYTTLDPTRFEVTKTPQISRADGSPVTSGDPWNGIVIVGDGFPGAAKGRIPAADNASVNRPFVGLPKGGIPTGYNDWGPRFSFACDPQGNGKTAVRGGFGIFYDRIRTDFLGSGSNNLPFNTSANVFDGNVDNPGGATQRNFPPNLNGVFPGARVRSVMSFRFGVQRDIRQGLVAMRDHAVTPGRHLQRTINIDQLRTGTTLTRAGVNVNGLRPYPGVRHDRADGHGRQLERHQPEDVAEPALQGGSHVWRIAHLVEDAGHVERELEDIYNPRRDYRLSSIHRAHILTSNAVYELPWFRRSGSALARLAPGGWQLSGVSQYQGGETFTVTAPVDAARNGSASTRAEVIGNPNRPSSERTLTRWFNTEAFLPGERTTPGRFGNSGRNILTGPAYRHIDVALMKNFYFSESRYVQFLAESFNFANHPSFTSINTTVRKDSQGRPTPNYGQVNDSGPGRVMSLGLKFVF